MSEYSRNILRPFEENRDYMESRIASDTEKYRKGDFTVLVRHEDGTPAPEAVVTVEQQTHDFQHGISLFLLDEMENPEKCARYRELVAGAFNTATLPFYWKDLEPVQGQPRFAKDSPKVYRRPAPDLCLEFCREAGITPKAHCLVYDPWSPDWLPKAVPEIKAAYEKRFAELSERYSGQIHGWEVINETLFPRFGECTALYYEPELVEWSFALAKKYFPNNELIINEAHCNIWDVYNANRSAYYMQIERALQKGSRIDTIGLQFHMFYRRDEAVESTKRFYDPRHLYRVMDGYGAFGKPMQITELTIPAYSWEQEDEALQAEILEHLYRMWFSFRNMESIIYWNLTDGYTAFAPMGDMACGENYYHGGLTRFDLSEKPAYQVIRRLFRQEWHTKAAMEAGNAGASFRGFYGTYAGTVRLGEKEVPVSFHLKKGGETSIVVTV